MADSSKFGQVSPAFFADLGVFDIVITNEISPQEYVDSITKLGKKNYLAG